MRDDDVRGGNDTVTARTRLRHQQGVGAIVGVNLPRNRGSWESLIARG